jgi:hypothetical protein
MQTKIRALPAMVGALLLTSCNIPKNINTLDEVNRANSYFTDIPANTGPRIGDIYFIQINQTHRGNSLVQKGCHPDDSVLLTTSFGPIEAAEAGSYAWADSKSVKTNVNVTADLQKILAVAGTNIPGMPNLSAALQTGSKIFTSATQNVSNIRIETAQNPINAGSYYNDSISKSPNCAGFRNSSIPGYVLTRLQRGDVTFTMAYDLNLSAAAQAEAANFVSAKLGAGVSRTSSGVLTGNGLVTGYQLVDPLSPDKLFGPAQIALAAGQRVDLVRTIQSAIPGQAVGTMRIVQDLATK